MSGLPNTVRSRWLRVWPLLLLLLAGCASTMRLPAIDPTGQRIFLSEPAFTTIEPCTPAYPGGRGNFNWPRPAFTQPPAIPFCPPAPIAVPIASLPTAPVQPVSPVTTGPVAYPNLQDRLILSPARIVAPINTEVVLLAGICGPDGYYVTRQPIEWSLSQESVGQFVDLGEAKAAASFHRYRPQKFSNDYALAQTSTVAKQITRGTPSPHDDVWLQKGQSWISVYSSSQGVSQVTAVATGAENWDQRRQLARIHWVDAEWVLPAPAIVKAGTPHTLTTKVTRSTGGEPVEGWTVRYELAGGVPAGLGPAGVSFVDVPTDTNGLASVTLTQQDANSGSSRVLIRIRTPANGDQPVEVGQGFTTVTWSAPGLAVNVTGPEIGTPDSTLSYRIDVSNPGDLPATNVSVSATIPLSLTFLNANPPEEAFGNKLTWRLGNLAAGDSRAIEVNCRASRDGSVRFQVEARADGISPGRVASAATEILSQSLEVTLVDPPTSAVVGEKATFNIEITNVGARELENVVLVDSFDPGLEHSHGERSPIRRSLGAIAAGDSKRIAVSFVPRRAGTLCHTLEASAENGHSASKRACLTVAEPQLRIRVDKYGPGQAQVGDQVDYTIVVTNTGDGELTNVRVVDSYPGVLNPIEATDYRQHTDAGLEWFIPVLPQGESRRLQVVYECLAAARLAENQVTVTADGGASDITSARITITARESDANSNTVRRPPSTEAPPEAAEPKDTSMQVTVSASSRSVSVGDAVTYTIVLENGRETSDKAVVVSFKIAEGTSFKRFNSVSAELALRPPNDGRYEVERIAEIRAGGKRQFEVEVAANAVGEQLFDVQVVSLRHPEPIEKTVTIRVSARE